MSSTYGCHNRAPYLPIVQVKHCGQVTSFPFRMSPDCNYTHTDLGQADARCLGCKHRAEKQ